MHQDGAQPHERARRVAGVADDGVRACGDQSLVLLDGQLPGEELAELVVTRESEKAATREEQAPGQPWRREADVRREDVRIVGKDVDDDVRRSGGQMAREQNRRLAECEDVIDVLAFVSTVYRDVLSRGKLTL